MSRDFYVVLDIVLALVPETETALRLRLGEVRTSADYTPPDMRRKNWIELAALLEESLPWPPKRDWQQKVHEVMKGGIRDGATGETSAETSSPFMEQTATPGIVCHTHDAVVRTAEDIMRQTGETEKKLPIRAIVSQRMILDVRTPQELNVVEALLESGWARDRARIRELLEHIRICENRLHAIENLVDKLDAAVDSILGVASDAGLSLGDLLEQLRQHLPWDDDNEHQSWVIEPRCPKCGWAMHQCKTGDPGCLHCDNPKCDGERHV